MECRIFVLAAGGAGTGVPSANERIIDAVEPGKDVYVEKPMAHRTDDGFRMIEVVRQTKRVVQVGTQRPSYDLFFAAKQIVEAGALGEVRLVSAWRLNHQKGIRQAELTGKRVRYPIACLVAGGYSEHCIGGSSEHCAWGAEAFSVNGGR